MAHRPDLLIDGYISQSFSPNKDAENYFCNLLKTDKSVLGQTWMPVTLPDPGRGVAFVARIVPDASIPTLPMQTTSGYPLFLIDFSVMNPGTVVPQSLWSPRNVTDVRQYVTEAPLLLPIFFTQENGDLGLSLDDAANGRCQTLRDARMQAELGGKYTTYVRILWPGYKDFKRQVQIRDETPSKNPITIARFAHHIGRSVDAFLQNLTPNETHNPDDYRWIIGQNGVGRSNIRVIGAIHVSAGSWMPILQLNTYVF